MARTTKSGRMGKITQILSSMTVCFYFVLRLGSTLASHNSSGSPEFDVDGLSHTLHIMENENNKWLTQEK